MGRLPKEKWSIKDENPQLSLMPEYDWNFVRLAVDRVKIAWDLHKNTLKYDGPMLLAFSGGKDSVCLYFVCKKASEELGVPFSEMYHAQYNITNLDPPELVKFVRDNFPDVQMHHPEKTFWQLLLQKRIPPFRTQRWCCSELKEISSLRGGVTLTGVRRAESIKRSKRGGLEQMGKKLSDVVMLLNDNNELRKNIDYCMQKNVYTCNPLIDWSDKEVWDFIRHENLPYCSLYDEGFHRLGCIGCPLASDAEREKQFARWPGYERQYKRIFQRLVDFYKGDEERERGISQRALLFNSLFGWAGYV